MLPRQNVMMSLKQRQNQKGHLKHKQMRLSVNLVSLNAGQFAANKPDCPNKSVLGFGARKHATRLTNIEEKSVRQSQQTNDFWNLSRDSVNQLDLRAKIYSKQGERSGMAGPRTSQAFKAKASMKKTTNPVDLAFEKVNKEFQDELMLSGLKLTDKDVSRMSKKLKSMARVRVIKFEKNRLTGRVTRSGNQIFAEEYQGQFLRDSVFVGEFSEK